MVAAGRTKYTMILDHFAHLDWDCIRTFEHDYCHHTSDEGVDQIIAIGLNSFARPAPKIYFFTVYEMVFLRRFREAQPEQIA